MKTTTIVKNWKLRLLEIDGTIKALCLRAEVSQSVLSMWGGGGGEFSDVDMAVLDTPAFRTLPVQEALDVARVMGMKWSRSRSMVYTYIRVEWALVAMEEEYVLELIRVQS